jgi:hypothetical protein
MDSRLRGPVRPASLLGRASECALLDGLIGDIRRGESRSLVLRGEAGIGKTALLEYLIDSAPDLKVVRAVGVESEMELAYASLHQLCAPLLDRLEGLPTPQRDALRTVFGLNAGPAPDRFLVGLAVLSLLSEAAEQVRCCASSMTRSGSIRHQRSRLPSWRDASLQSRSGSSSPRVNRGRSFSTCPRWRCTACATATRARC